MPLRHLFITLLGFMSLGQAAWAKPSYIVMPYLPMWSTGISNASLPWANITYIAEAFGLPQANGATPTFAAPGQRAGLISTAHSNNTYVIYSLGGATASNANWTSSTTAGNLNTFVTNIMNIVGTYGYDGVDIDWEFPAASDKTQFTNLMVALSAALKNPANPNYKGTAYDGTPKKLSFYISPGYFICGVDWSNTALHNAIDFAVLPGYDICAGPGWEGPINGAWTFSDCRGISVGLTVSGNMNKLSGGGVNQFTFPKSKMVLGIPFYNCAGSTLEAVTASGSHSTLDATTQESTWSSGAMINDSWAFCSKMTWAQSQGFQGIAMWDLSQAYPTNGTSEVGNTWNVIGNNTGCWPGAVNTATATPTHTRSRTASPTWTGSPTRSATPSPTATATRTPSMTASASASPSPSVTRSATPSASPTFSATRSATASFSPTPTISPSPTATFSGSPSATRSASPSATPSFSNTRSATASATATVSPTASATRSATPSLSPTRSASPSPSPSATSSATASNTPSHSATFTASHTPSISPTATEIIVSATPTLSFTQSDTYTSSPTASPSSTASATASASNTLSASPTLTSTPSETLSASNTPFASPTPSLTSSPTATHTLTASSSPTLASTGTITASATPTLISTFTTSPTLQATNAAGGQPKIDQCLAVPNPQSGPVISVQILISGGPADKLMFRIYTKAMHVVAQHESSGSFGPGWVNLSAPRPSSLSSGLYYAIVSAQGQGASSGGPTAKIVLLNP